MRERYDQLTWELRCPKCQNQNIADSNSPISLDLKDEIHHLLERGLSNKEIKAHLTSRYSDFILYRPQVNKTTSLLWGSPILILFIGGWLVFRLSRRSNELKQENLKRIQNYPNGTKLNIQLKCENCDINNNYHKTILQFLQFYLFYY